MNKCEISGERNDDAIFVIISERGKAFGNEIYGEIFGTFDIKIRKREMESFGTVTQTKRKRETEIRRESR